MRYEFPPRAHWLRAEMTSSQNVHVRFIAGGNGKAAKSSDEIGRIAAIMIHSQNWPTSLPQAEFAGRFV